MPVSVKVYVGKGSEREIRRFVFRPDDPKGKDGIYQNLLDRIRALYNGLNLHQISLCWKDDDGDYVVFSSDDELRVAITSVTDNTLRIFVKEKEALVKCPSVGVSFSSYPSTPRLPRRSTSERGGGDPLPHHAHFHHNHLPPGLDHQQPSTSATNLLSMRHSTQAGMASSNEHITNNHIPIVTYSPEPQELEGLSGGDYTPVLNHLPHHFSPVSSAGGGYSDGHLVAAIAAVAGGSSSVTFLCCSECRGEGRGVWYKCTSCNCYYLCSNCENRGLHDQHIMVRIPTSGSGSNR